LHTCFDHSRFAKLMSECSHKWLITYDNCEQVRHSFSFAYIYEWELQYGMNSATRSPETGRITRPKGKELIITNYLGKGGKGQPTLNLDN
jgi:DNA adenine methylase